MGNLEFQCHRSNGYYTIELVNHASLLRVMIFSDSSRTKAHLLAEALHTVCGHIARSEEFMRA